jgi:hypothetical protein
MRDFQELDLFADAVRSYNSRYGSGQKRPQAPHTFL